MQTVPSGAYRRTFAVESSLRQHPFACHLRLVRINEYVVDWVRGGFHVETADHADGSYLEYEAAIARSR